MNSNEYEKIKRHTITKESNVLY